MLNSFIILYILYIIKKCVDKKGLYIVIIILPWCTVMLTSGGESRVQSILNEKMTAISMSEKRGWTSINKAYTSVRKLIFMV